MFITIREPVEVYDQPSLNGAIVGHIGIDQTVQVQGTPISAEGWIWHEVEGGGLWVIERSADGNNLLITMKWTGQGNPPVVPGMESVFLPKRAFPDQPAEFKNSQLLQAIKEAAAALRAKTEDWLNAAGLPWLANVANEFYEGTPIAELPGLEDEAKLTILAKLKALLSRPTIETQPAEAAKGGRFTVQNGEFRLDGKPFRFVGVNVREIAYYGFAGWGHGQFARPEHIDLQLQTAASMKAQVFRFYAPYNRTQAEEKTNVKEAVKRIKTVLDKAQKLNMFALITLDDAKQSGFNVSANNQKYREPGFVANMPFYYGGYKEQFLPFVEEVVGALADHPAVFAWGVNNEAQVNPFIPPTPPDADCEAFLDYYRTVSQTIRRLAPKHLITTSIESCHHLFVVNAYEGKKYANTLYTMPSIDFATVHTYQDSLRMDNVLGHNAEIGTRELELARKVWKKPLIIEEMGCVGGPQRGTANWTVAALAKWFELGAAGCMQWGFSAADGDIGVGDADSGMHRVPAGHPGLPGHDWDILFNAYKSWGDQFWVG